MLEGTAFSLGQEVVLTLPMHRHTMSALLLIFHYRPTLLAHSQRASANTVKSDLLPTLVRRIATRIRLGDAAGQLSRHMESTEVLDALLIRHCVVDAMQWCQILIDDAFTSGVVDKTLSSVKQLLDEIEPIIENANLAMRCCAPSAMLIYQVQSAQNLCAQIESLLASKRAWNDLQLLAQTIEDHRAKATARRAKIEVAFRTVKAASACGTSESEEVTAAAVMIYSEMDFTEISISGHAMFIALMARLKQATDEEEGIQPQEAVQVSDQIIQALKELRIGPALQLHDFLKAYGPPREEKLEQLLVDFCHAADTVKLQGVPFLPPPRQLPFLVLYHCRVLVENHAARIKGWGGLGPTVEKDLDIFQRCAEKIDAMTAHPGKRTAADAFAQGCLYAASARLIRLLQVRLQGWKKGVEGRAAASVPSIDSSSSDPMQTSAPSSWDGIEDFNFEELFSQWNEWANADNFDFSSIFGESNLPM